MAELVPHSSGLFVPENPKQQARARIVRALRLVPEIIQEAYTQQELEALASSPELLATVTANVFNLVLHEGLADD